MPARVCAHLLSVWSVLAFFAESKSSSKATDKATAGGWVAGWRRDGREANGVGVSKDSMSPLITLLDSEEKAD